MIGVRGRETTGRHQVVFGLDLVSIPNAFPAPVAPVVRPGRISHTAARQLRLLTGFQRWCGHQQPDARMLALHSYTNVLGLLYTPSLTVEIHPLQSVKVGTVRSCQYRQNSEG